MKFGLVGLPNSGKTTIFNLLTGQTLPAGDFFTSSTEVHLGVTRVIDDRLTEVHRELPEAKLKYAEMTFVDTAGFMAGSGGKSGGTDARFFAALRDVDAIAYVICAFDNPEVLQVFDVVDPVRDVKTLELEMILSDLDMIEKRLERIEKELQSSKDKHTPEKDVLIKCKQALDEEIPLRRLEFTDDEEKLLSGFRFISQKPLMVLLNIDENDIGKPIPEDIDRYCSENSFPLMALSGKIEEEISECSEEEQAELRSGMGIKEPALPKFIHTAYDSLDLISFFTMAGKEVRAWSIRRGSTAWEAAGKVHTDMQRGFIRAEVISYADFEREGGIKHAKEKHCMRLEGKDYVVNDGDIVFFRFNV